MKKAIAWILVLGAMTAARAEAQGVRGSVREPSGQPVVPALLTLIDSAGIQVASDSTREGGVFAIVVGRSGVYSLRVERPGFAAYETEPFTLAGDSIRTLIVRVDAERVYLLDSLTATATRDERQPLVKTAQGKPTNVLTDDEIDLGGAMTALDIVRLNRPGWLRLRGAVRLMGGPTPVQVYLDGMKMGSAPDALARIPAPWVARMQFLDGIDAGAYYGLGHDNGAIVINSRKR